MPKIVVINGVNMNLLGKREPEIYGGESLSDVEGFIAKHCAGNNCEVEFFHSNIEGELVEAVQSASDCDGVVINAGAYSHYSIALRDAIVAINAPCFEVHMSNIFAREQFRNNSLLASVCVGSVCGMGKYGYVAAVDFLLNKGCKG